MRVICIKNFKYQDSTYIKNIKYELVEYMDIFYVSIVQDSGPYPAYPLDYKFRDNFVTLIELRKLKLKKIYDKISK